MVERDRFFCKYTGLTEHYHSTNALYTFIHSFIRLSMTFHNLNKLLYYYTVLHFLNLVMCCNKTPSLDVMYAPPPAASDSVHFSIYKQGLFKLLAIRLSPRVTQKYRGADKSLARPGRKQDRKHVTDARDFINIQTRTFIKFFFSCKARRRRKLTLF